MGAKVFVLSGAGISQESGISTFRDQNGLWENHSIEEVATVGGFLQNPSLVHQFYNLRRKQLKSVQPNLAHFALANFEQKFSGELFLVTQNVDDLHERAGSKNVYHMHGELKKIICIHCKKSFFWLEDLSIETMCNFCQRIGGLRPDIVWFGEMPYYLKESENFLRSADVFLSIGTSGSVYPAAGFVQLVGSKAKTIEINMEKTETSFLFSEKRYGKATDMVPKVLIKLLEEY